MDNSEERKRRNAEYKRKRRAQRSQEQILADRERDRLRKAARTTEQRERQNATRRIQRATRMSEEIKIEIEAEEIKIEIEAEEVKIEYEAEESEAVNQCQSDWKISCITTDQEFTNNDVVRQRRAERTPEQILAEQERDRIRKAARSVDQKERDNAARRIRRATRTPAAIQAENKANRLRRAERTPEQREADNEIRRKRRLARTSEQRGVDIQRQREWRIRRLETDPEFRKNELVRQRKYPPPSKYAARNANNRPDIHDLGNRDVVCPECNAIHFKAEKTSRGIFSSCCAGGNIRIKQPEQYPEQLQSWLTEESVDGKNFQANIRKYNSAFAFASFQCKLIKFDRGLQPVVVHGPVYHNTVQSLQYAEKPTHGQLFFLEPEFANKERMNNQHNVKCNLQVLGIIDGILREVNPFATAFKMMGDSIKENVANIHMWIIKDRRDDPRSYNLPLANEVAVVLSGDEEPPFNCDISVYPTGEYHLQQLSIISPNLDPMTYPLLFPRGEPGWQPGTVKQGLISMEDDEEGEEKKRNVSILEFYSYQLHERTAFNPLLHARKLTQQFIIDAFLKVEEQRLQWNRHNQRKLRVDFYLGLMDYVNSEAEERGLKAGRLVLLPSSFTGGKRCLQENYRDAMVLVAKFGKPDLFITFICNPKWKEITDQLRYNETAMDRPDIVSTVFYLKLKEFMNDMISDRGGVLGKVEAYISVIEFQKRGLPHCYMLFILEDEDKLREPEDIDKVSCAEIPDQSDQELYDIVTRCMIHGPCGEMKKDASCMEEGNCTKKFPRSFSDTTVANVDGYPVYRRRNNGRKVKKGPIELDNRWVVPYNPWLARKYNAHINVEVCSSVKSANSIFKYIYKGHNDAMVKLNENTGTLIYDEIESFLETRCISAPEAMWRLRKYEMYNRSHAVERLPVHLPSRKTDEFPDDLEEESLRHAEIKGSKLNKWFQLNQHDPAACQYLYHEIPYHYVWRGSLWKRRQRGATKILPRMYSVSPKDVERFCLQLLLLHIRGAQSFDHLKTIDGIKYESFLEAAKAMNLLEDDGGWQKTMEEASLFRMPTKLRELYTTILIHAIPTDPKTLYEDYKQVMMEDFLQTHEENMAEQLALKDIENQLNQFGKRCTDFGHCEPVDYDEHYTGMDMKKVKEESQMLIDMLNTEQRTAYDIIIEAINGKRQQNCYYLSGAGGCGKTFLYNALIATILSQGGIVTSVATTGLAATLMKGGKMVHSGFGISVNLDQKHVSRFKQGTPEWRELIKTNLIIWDEISVCHVDLFNAVNRSLQDLLNSSEPFGGIPILVGGDFRQQAPVMRMHDVKACVKSLPLWGRFQELELVRNMRVKQDEVQFMDWLLEVGSGKIGDWESEFVKLDPQHITSDIIASVFGSNINALSAAEVAARAILCLKNEDTLKFNEKILSQLKGDSKSYYSMDSIGECDNDQEKAQYPLEFLHSLTPMGFPQHILQLKKGCCVTLLRNLNPKRGLCNGTRLIVESLGINLIECSVITGEHYGERTFIPRVKVDVKNNNLPFQLIRKQFPLRLAYAMTIMKAQGQSFDRIGVYLPSTVYTHGQLYTAFSRVRSKDGLFIEMQEGPRQGAIFDNDSGLYIYNCVYQEILCN